MNTQAETKSDFVVLKAELSFDPNDLIVTLAEGSKVSAFLHKVECHEEYTAQNNRNIPNIGIVITIEFATQANCEKVFKIIMRRLQQNRDNIQDFDKKIYPQKKPIRKGNLCTVCVYFKPDTKKEQFCQEFMPYDPVEIRYLPTKPPHKEGLC